MSPINSSAEQLLSETSLSLANVSPNDEGMYTCDGGDGIGTSSFTLTLRGIIAVQYSIVYYIQYVLYIVYYSILCVKYNSIILCVLHSIMYSIVLYRLCV